MNYIERICSPCILIDKFFEITTEDSIGWLERQGLRYEFEERAAILEYDGGLTREEADRQALREITERIDLIHKAKNFY